MDAEMQKEKEDSGTHSFEILRSLKFEVNTMNADMEFMKKLFNNDRIAKMNAQEERI